MEIEVISQQPPAAVVSFTVKLLFWVLLGSLSVILAEVVSFSSPFAFFNTWGILVVFPLYTLHTLVLAFLIFRRKQITLPVLFLAGMLFGLYEAYITKVLWNPTWGDAHIMLGGVAVVQTAVLILFWHPFMAFILPVILAENLFTTSNETFVALPTKIQSILNSRRGRIASLVAFAVYCGIYQGTNAPSPWTALLSGLSATAVFGGLALWWSIVQRKHALTFRQLLPAGKEAAVLAGLLGLLYLLSGLFTRPEAMPHTIGPHLTIWAIYALAIVLLLANLKNAPVFNEAFDSASHPPAWKWMAGFWVVLLFSAAIFTLVKPAAYAAVLLSWVVGIGTGISLLIRACLVAVRKKGAGL
jgi:hypothetical protein